MRSLTSMIQPIALMKPGTMMMTAINAMKASRKGKDVRFNSHANGTAKNVATRTVPIPTINVFGSTWVIIRGVAIFAQFSRVSPGSVGRPGTKVMYRTNKTRKSTKDRSGHDKARGSVSSERFRI